MYCKLIKIMQKKPETCLRTLQFFQKKIPMSEFTGYMINIKHEHSDPTILYPKLI